MRRHQLSNWGPRGWRLLFMWIALGAAGAIAGAWAATDVVKGECESDECVGLACRVCFQCGTSCSQTVDSTGAVTSCTTSVCVVIPEG